MNVHMPVLLPVAMLLLGCEQRLEPISMPDSPDGTVKAIIEAVSTQNPRMIWAVLPPRYQSDITGLVHQFARAVDRRTYEDMFHIARRLADVLERKKDMLNLVLRGRSSIEAGVDIGIELLRTVANSDAASITRLRGLDIERFLLAAGPVFLKEFQTISHTYEIGVGTWGGRNFWPLLTGAKVEVDKVENYSATVNVTPDGGRPRAVRLIKTGERWIPTHVRTMFGQLSLRPEDWTELIADGRSALEKMAAEKARHAKAWRPYLKIANKLLTRVDEATTAQELQEVMRDWGRVSHPMTKEMKVNWVALVTMYTLRQLATAKSTIAHQAKLREAKQREAGPRSAEENEATAIRILKQLSSAQAHCQASGAIDVNRNGSGEYGFFGELSGAVDVRGADGRERITPPILTKGYRNVKNGRVRLAGYVFQIFLADEKGNAVREAPSGGADPTRAPSAHNSERFYACYGWPSKYGVSGRRAFFINQMGDLLATDNNVRRYSSDENPPDPDAAFAKGQRGILGTPAIEKPANDGQVWQDIN